MGREVIIEAVFSPYTYVYASWFLIVWPWPTAILLGIAASLVGLKHIRGDAGVYEQLFMLDVALTWLIIVPVVHVNGYIKGWPLAFFVEYSLFFLINFYIRYSYHLDVSAVPIDKKWDLRPSRIAQVRHPIYASYMILFTAYFCALRAYGSLAFVLLACGIYYDRKGKLEEAAMEENFKELYTEYRDKVKYRLIPFIY